MPGLSKASTKLRRTPSAQRNLLHYIIVRWYQVLVDAVTVAEEFRIFSSKRGRMMMYDHTLELSRTADILHGKKFPVVRYESEGNPIHARRPLASLVRDAMYVSHTGRLPGKDRQRRNRRLRKWGYLP